jgi:quercetin dioxygenase-like cupin family protein
MQDQEENTMSTDASRAQAEQDAIWWQGSLFRIKGRRENTRGAIGLTEAHFYAGFATPVHVHHREDEAWYVLEGELRIRLGSEELTASEGDFIFGPREIPHGFKALEYGARALLLTVPAGLEHMFLEGGLAVGDPAQPPPKVFDIERVRVLAQKYGLDIIGPPLE